MISAVGAVLVACVPAYFFQRFYAEAVKGQHGWARYYLFFACGSLVSTFAVILVST